jgi:hypothetical protein
MTMIEEFGSAERRAHRGGWPATDTKLGLWRKPEGPLAILAGLAGFNASGIARGALQKSRGTARP